MATRGPMHPQEFEERLREANDEGYRKAVRQQDQRVDDLKDELRDLKALLWAAAMTSKPTPLRISRVARAAYDTHAQLTMGEDLATGDVLVFAVEKER